MLKQKLNNNDDIKAGDVREEIGQLQQQSLKLFEAAYKKMAERNTTNNTESQNSDQKSSESEQQKKN